MLHLFLVKKVTMFINTNIMLKMQMVPKFINTNITTWTKMEILFTNINIVLLQLRNLKRKESS